MEKELQTAPLKALTFIRDAFTERRKKNSAYSIAAYARDLGVSPSFLSRVLAGKRPVTISLAMQVASILGIPAKKAEEWVTEIIATAPRTAKISKKVRSTLRRKEITASIRNYSLERFQVISQWYHLAILNLTYLRDFRPETKWIARRLGLTQAEAAGAIERLFALGLLEKKSGTWRCTENSLLVDTRKSESCVREFHRQMSDKAKDALLDGSEEAFSRRYISGVTLAFDQARLPDLIERLKSFQKEIIQVGADASLTSSTDVFHLNLQLFPLTKKQESPV